MKKRLRCLSYQIPSHNYWTTIRILCQIDFHHGLEVRFSSWSRSAPDTGELFQHNRNVVHTGPLISERKIAFVEMSGPLYIRKKSEEPCGPTSGVLGHRGKVQLEEDKYSTYDGGAKNGRMQDGIAKKNEHLLKSGQLGMCNDPYCTTCPSDYNYKAAQRKFRRTSDIFDTKEHKCIAVDRGMAITMVVLRSITDIIYLFHILLQFRLAYVSPESRVAGAGDSVDHPTKIALHYLSGFFMIDMFSVLPIHQESTGSKTL